jgi:hypothetical protein
MKTIAMLILLGFAVVGFLSVFKVYTHTGGICITPRPYIKEAVGEGKEQMKPEKLKKVLKKFKEARILQGDTQKGEITEREKESLEKIIIEYGE